MGVFKAGDRIAGAYELVARIGAGGMGSVWTAKQLALGQRVAIKFIAPRHDGRDELRARRFEREAHAAARVQHPSLIEIKDYGLHDDDTPFLVMELLEGETLKDRLARGPMSAAEAATLCRQLCGALSRVHAAGIVHRDVKPENIFLVDAPGLGLLAKLLDFGIAKVESSETLTHEGVPGTRAYMSPEQLREEAVDGRTDLWSLAVVLYECLIGQRPFRGRGHALAEAIVAGELEPPSCVVPSIPVAFDEWFAVALAVDVEDRFASAEALAESFERLCAGRAWQAPGSPLPEEEPTLTAPAAERAPSGDSLEGTETVALRRERSSWLLWSIAGGVAALVWLVWPALSSAPRRHARPSQRALPLVAHTATTIHVASSAPAPSAPTTTSASSSPALSATASATAAAPSPPIRPRAPAVASSRPPLYEEVPF